MGFAHLRAPFHFKKHFSRSKSTASGLPALPGHGHPEDSENPNYPSAANPKASRFSTATHAAKNALKTTLVIAKEATAGLPLPVQGVIGGVISIIEVAEQTKSNKEALVALNDRCRILIDSVVNSLRGKEDASIPSDLKASLDKLSIGLVGIYESSALNVKRGFSLAVINRQDHTSDIQDLNTGITRLLENFWLETNIAGALVMQQILERSDPTNHVFSPEIKKIPDADKPYEPFTDADEPKRKQRLDQIATFYGNYNIIRGNQDNSTTKAIGDINSSGGNGGQIGSEPGALGGRGWNASASGGNGGAINISQ